MQPQFQVAQSEGAASLPVEIFLNFPKAGLCCEGQGSKLIIYLQSKTNFPKALFTFQIDATERGVIVRDMFVRLFETKTKYVFNDAGFFARPFGYEVNLASAYQGNPGKGKDVANINA